MNPERAKDIKSILTIFGFALVITLIVSAIFAGGAKLLGFSFWGTLLVFTGIQGLLGWLVNMVSTKAYNSNMLESQSRELLANAYQNVGLACAHCNVKNAVRIAVGKENSFTCAACNCDNKVHLEFTTAQSTKPLTTDKVLKDIFDKISDEAIAEVDQNKINTEEIKVEKTSKKDKIK